MAEFDPALGSTSPAVLLDNAKRLDELVNGPAADVPDRAGDPLYSWRGIHQNLIPLSKQYMTLAAAQADIANIPDGSTTYVRSPDGGTLADEYINNGGTLAATGRSMPSQGYIDSLIKPVGIDSPVLSVATKDGLSVCSFYVNEDTGNIEMIVDKIPQVNADAMNLNGVIAAASDSDILAFQDKNGLEVGLVDLIAQVANGGSPPTSSDAVALLSADAAAYIAQNYNLKRHPVAVIRHGLNIWFVCGQSFTLGTAAKGILTRTDSALGNLMLGQSPRGTNLNPSANNTFSPIGGSNTYYPLREVRQLDNGLKVADDYSGSSTFGETILSGFLETLKDYHNRSKGVVNDSAVTLAGSCCGTVGVSIMALKKGATEGYYNRFLSCLSGHMEAASTSGYSDVQVAGIIWMQGQNDTGGMTTAEYLGHLTDIKSSMIADCMSATSQKEAPGFFIAQTGGMYVGNTQKLEVQMAQIGLAEQDTGAFFLHNDFPYPRPANHWYANSYRWAGCQYAKEIYPVISGLNLNPFKPLNAVYDGQAIYVSFSPLYAPLTKQPFFTGTAVTDHADYGFTVIDDNGTHYGSAITVEIASDTVIKITPTFTPSGAMTVVLGDANHAGGHNIADSDDQVALYKWTYETGYGLDAGENIAALVNNAYPLFNRSASYSISVRAL
ncbi:flagellar biosynthesis, cell-distal portion of basal-body rod [Klebsiella pneumoniae]|uniref:hypothetical protein n=1 Tax=Klebsiella pneumoniae TaxID=573 RepID=UPI0009BA90EE|nr:hypothetical protein [Klebsiella pneumoniae]SLU58416.1 flagellar biosynthesis, cell-distal portion of basal-body rod [Klebsiella pneumoniae]SLU76099.1 flagellar biosynthesis, cell-distal portion of basal-body rod [Klebsiella pneumoniae]SLU84396.1 flagellar biosynthesis, cell-distal portion of basal-body rod [Klebsiella pneumoniae]DAM29169.1 MAG TPA: tail spike [Caudoviricetes sp.]